MPEPIPRHDAIDLSDVQDPDVRRALRLLQQHFADMLTRQQSEIDALLETLMEKHVTSLGEFKRIVMRLQQNAARTGRIHDVMTMAAQPPSPPPHMPMA